MKIRRAFGLLDDGTAWEGVPVYPVTSLALEKTMKANQWTTDDNGLTISAFVSWHAAKRAGVPIPERFEDFQSCAIAADFEADDVDPTTVRSQTRTWNANSSGETTPTTD